MSTTIGAVISSVRVILQDTVTPYRYADATLYRLFSEAVADARRLRPDLFLTTIFGDLPSYSPFDRQDPFPLWEAYKGAFVNYVVGRAELADDQTGDSSRAGQLLSSFKAQLSTAMA